MSYVKVHTPHFFMLNAGALGDTIAAFPTLKYAADNIFANTNSFYTVMVRDYFVPLMSFIPQKNIKTIGTAYSDPRPQTIVHLNDVKASENGPTADINPLRMSLIDYASIKLLGTILPIEHKNYPLLPVNGVSISKFNLPKRYVCICASDVNKNRALPSKEVVKVAEYLLSMGITPIYLGATVRPFDTYGAGALYGKSATAIPGVIDLTDKTTLMEAAKIMSKAECVVGADMGLIHLAAMSDVKIICCYTTVRPDLRMPVRHNQLGWNVIPISPDDSSCKFCQSDWWLNGWNYNECFNGGSFECLSATKADKIIAALSTDLIMNLAFK